MIHTLSILIPTYNHVCLELVKNLQAQAFLLPQLTYEILVADDGSSNQDVINQNKEINQIPHCQYIIRKENEGRAVIRNFLAQQAQYEWLLFIDADMVIRNSQYLANYMNDAQEKVVYGGYQVKEPSQRENLNYNLRHAFEKANTLNAHCQERQAHPYANFHTCNFLVHRSIMLQYPLDERFRHYGYEDVLWGKTLQQNGIGIQHIDNPVSFEEFESNVSFLHKTEEGLRTLYCFQKELEGYSKIIEYAHHLEKFHLCNIIQKAYPWLCLPIKARLTGNKPSIFLFNIYKLIYFIHLKD